MLRTNLTNAMKDAMKAGDKARLSTVRLILAELKLKDIANRDENSREGVPDADIYKMLESMVKKRRDSIEMYEKGGRPDIAAQEQQEILVIQEFMPKMLSDAEAGAAIIKAIQEVDASSIKDMGKVMTYLREHYAGQIDLGQAGGQIKAKLSA